MTGTATLAAILADLTAHADPAAAASQRAYLKSNLRFLGVTVPQLRQTATVLAPPRKQRTAAWLRELADAAWATDLHDARTVACVLLQASAKLLTADDLPWLEALLRRCHTWAYVDLLAVHVAGDIAKRHPAAAKAVLQGWATDGDFWIRRSALLALLGEHRKGAAFDAARFEAWAVPMLGEKEFFIRKAIGWVLRDVGRKNRPFVQGFVDRHGAQMSGLTRREAAKALSAAAAN